MNCSEVQQRLSAYLDGELSDADRQRVAGHLTGCSACCDILAGFQSLSESAKSLAAPLPPDDLWQRIESSLGAESAQIVTLPPLSRTWRRFPRSSWAAAASILLVATAAIWASHGIWGGHDHDAMAAIFDLYLAEYSTDPEVAHETLVRAYDGRLISRDNAKQLLGYTPAALDRSLADIAPEKTYVLEMPCCRCSLSVCRQADGKVVAVLEHETPQPAWFGDRSRIECVCDGVPTSVVQVDGMLAASWQIGKRFVTVIGPRDLSEVTRLVSAANASNEG